MHSRCVVLVLLLAACVPQPSPDGAALPAPAPSAPSAPHAELAPFVLSDGDVARASVVPAPSSEPLVRWGPLPPGQLHGERVRTFDLQHQQTRLVVDWTRHALTGTTTLTIAALDSALRTVALDAVDMRIASVTGADRRALRYSYNDRTLAIELARPLAARGRTTITIGYETTRPRKGFYFIDRARAFWTQGEPDETRYWVPTYDYPNDKATWEFRVVVPRGHKALSNGRLVATWESPQGTEWHWSLTRPASTYLMSVAGGDYEIIRDRHGDVPVNYWTYPDSLAAARRGFGRTPAMLRIFESRIGLPYPWEKYDQITVPDFIYSGMENVTAVTQRDNAILWPAEDEPQKNSDALVAHELAHQWFGDLVTLRDWGEAWLNEGFAAFMETIYYEDSGEPERAALDRRGNIADAISADRRARRPLVYRRWQTTPFELFFSGHIYPKGAAVLQTLRAQLGDSLFWRGINDYATRHAFQPVGTEGLRASFERATGRDLSAFFRKWIYGAGFPVFRVGYRYDSSTRSLTISAQEVQPRDSLTGFFDPDVAIEVLTDAGPVRDTVRLRSGSGRTAITLSGPPRAIVWDHGNWWIDVTDFPRPTTMIAHQLLHSTDVGARHDAIDELLRRAPDAYAHAALTRAATSAPYWATRARAIEVLESFPPHALTRRALLDAASHADARVREAAARALRRYTDADSARRLRELAERDPSSAVRRAAGP